MGLLGNNSATDRPHPDGSSSRPRSNWHETRYKLVSRSLTSLLVVAAMGSLVAAQPSDSTDKTKSDSSNDSSKQVQLDVVEDSTKEDKSSVSGQKNNGVTNTLDVHSSTSGNTAKSDVSVTVNGQEIPVPNSGSTQQTVTTPGGSTSVNVSNNSSGNGTSFNSSFSSTSLSSFGSSSSIDTNFQQNSGAP